MIPRSSLSYVLARLRCPTHLLKCPHWASLPAPEVALAAKECQRRTWRRFQTSFRRMDICICWRLGCRQSSFHRIARIARRTAPYAWTRPPVSWHAIFPVHLSDHESAIRSRDISSRPCPLRERYNAAPRGAATTPSGHIEHGSRVHHARNRQCPNRSMAKSGVGQSSAA